jgi:HAD superfamily hydrolase (TIGR01484 family)
MNKILALENWTADSRANIKFVFADIDDTLTTDGRIPSSVYLAMERLRQQGLLMIPITGRPAGWCDMIARTWPVDGVVGENGALAFCYDAPSRHMRRLYMDPADIREENRRRLSAIRQDVLNTVSGVQVAADQPYRETDLAIDFNEDVSDLPESAIDETLEIFKKHGATAKVSSIHVNGWFGTYDKLTMTKRLMSDVFDVTLDDDNSACVYIGDSPNDAPMFKFFNNAVGVANLQELQDRCPDLPAWITPSARSEGFVEMADAILAAIK